MGWSRWQTCLCASDACFAAHAGWVPVTLPWWEWKEVAAREDLVRAYLEFKLEEALMKIVDTGG